MKVVYGPAFSCLILDYGTKTCEGYPGSIDYVEQDAEVRLHDVFLFLNRRVVWLS